MRKIRFFIVIIATLSILFGFTTVDASITKVNSIQLRQTKSIEDIVFIINSCKEQNKYELTKKHPDKYTGLVTISITFTNPTDKTQKIDFAFEDGLRMEKTRVKIEPKSTITREFTYEKDLQYGLMKTYVTIWRDTLFKNPMIYQYEIPKSYPMD